MFCTSCDVQHCCITVEVIEPMLGVAHHSAVISTSGMYVGTELGLQRLAVGDAEDMLADCHLSLSVLQSDLLIGRGPYSRLWLRKMFLQINLRVFLKRGSCMDFRLVPLTGRL